MIFVLIYILLNISNKKLSLFGIFLLAIDSKIIHLTKPNYLKIYSFIDSTKILHYKTHRRRIDRMKNATIEFLYVFKFYFYLLVQGSCHENHQTTLHYALKGLFLASNTGNVIRTHYDYK